MPPEWQGERDRHRVILFALLAYNLYAGTSYERFPLSNYNYVTMKQLPNEISVSLGRASEHREATKPYCPTIVEFDGRAWQRIKHPSNFWNDQRFDYDEKAVAHQYGLHGAGGMWKPANCNAVHNVTLIVPYRDRISHLKKFILHIHPFLQAQMIQYKILVVEQVDEKPFNRAGLFNVGFAESMKYGGTHCYIFHDVDLIPLNLKNVYGCTHHPRHMSAALNNFRYMLSYSELFGGAIAITREQFRMANGFSNRFYGWGGEDDDFFRRLENKGLKIIRLSPVVSTYRMVPHVKQPENEGRVELLQQGKQRYETDGLINVNYTVVNHIEGPLYTLIQIAFR